MIKNYLIVALRNLKRNKIFSLINVLGLSIGISASLVIFLIIQYGYSFDRFEKEGDRIFRVVSAYNFQGNPGYTRGIPAPLGNAVKKELSGIDQTANFRYYSVAKTAVQSNNPAKPAMFKAQNNVIFADEHYFELLSYKWLAGSAQSALEDPARVVLSESRAKLYFPTLNYADIIGRKVIYDDTLTTLVSGIVQDFEKQGNTDFSFKEFISMPTLLTNHGLRDKFYWDSWGSTTSDQQLYVRLSKGTPAASVEARLKVLFDKYKGEDARKNHYTWSYLLQPLSDIHFNSHYGTLTGDVASKPMLYSLMLVAVFLLLLGSINFINLTTAQASQRAKEIGIRKTLGSSRRQLIFQFLSETFVTTLIATIISILLTPLLLKAFTSFIPEGLHFSWTQSSVVVFLAVLVLVVGLLAGIYPALVLSSWNPSQVLKSQASTGSGNTRRNWLRQGLTVSQFIIAQFFVMGTLLVSKQIHFMLDKDLGFNKEAILSFNIPGSDTSYSHRIFLLSELKRIPGISIASFGSDIPSSFGWWTTTMKYKMGQKETETQVELKAGDSNYLKLFNIPLLAGRALLPSDTVKEIIINETYLHVLGFNDPVDAIGKTLNWDNKDVPIVGVMKDFHAHPLNYKIAPMAFCQSAKDYHDVAIALQPRTSKMNAGSEDSTQKSDWQLAISKIEKTFKKAYPAEDFSYAFLDESITNSYGNEQNTSQLLKWATGLTIFISCLGMLGLVIYTTNRRTKEIGIRKVLGASVAEIVSILSKDFIRLVAIAFVIATPLSWWAMNVWLEDFTFRTSISWWVFLVSGLGMIAVALITLSLQTVRAAMANPVTSLRTE